MKIEVVVGVLLLVALAYALYVERTRRRKAELENEISKRRAALDELRPKIDTNKAEYDAAQAELFGNPVPSFMLDNVGKPVSTVTGRKPGPDTGGKDEGGTAH